METFSDRFRSYFMEAYEREAAPSWDLSSASIEEALSRVDSPARAHALAVLFPLQIMQITAGISMPEGITLERSPEEVAAFINQVLEEIRPNSGREALAERLTIKRPILLRIADEVRRAHFDLGVLSSDTMLRLGADISNRGASSARVWVKNAEKRLVVLEAVARLAHSYADMDFLQSPTIELGPMLGRAMSGIHRVEIVSFLQAALSTEPSQDWSCAEYNRCLVGVSAVVGWKGLSFPRSP